jgi:hypothetical protein
VRLLVAGGGTGGHLFPGIAIADEVASRGDSEVLFVGTSRGIETRAVPAAGSPPAARDPRVYGALSRGTEPSGTRQRADRARQDRRRRWKGRAAGTSRRSPKLLLRASSLKPFAIGPKRTRSSFGTGRPRRARRHRRPRQRRARQRRQRRRRGQGVGRPRGGTFARVSPLATSPPRSVSISDSRRFRSARSRYSRPLICPLSRRVTSTAQSKVGRGPMRKRSTLVRSPDHTPVTSTGCGLAASRSGLEGASAGRS